MVFGNRRELAFVDRNFVASVQKYSQVVDDPVAAASPVPSDSARRLRPDSSLAVERAMFGSRIAGLFADTSYRMLPVMPETNHSGIYELSKSAGVVVSAASIALCAGLFVPILYFGFPAGLPDLVAVLIASLLLPIVALFRPLQSFVFVPGGLELSNLITKKAYCLEWSNVTKVELTHQALGFQNLVLTEKGSRIRKKVPLSLLNEPAAFVSQLEREFPGEHPLYSAVRGIVSGLSEPNPPASAPQR